MNANGRTIAVVIMLVGVTAVGILEHQPALIVGVYGTVLGYVFGDRNGEKRLVNELTASKARVAAGVANDPGIAATVERIAGAVDHPATPEPQ